MKSLVDKSAESVVRASISNGVARFDVPSKISTDKGRQFEVLGAHRIHITSYHPASNGII